MPVLPAAAEGKLQSGSVGIMKEDAHMKEKEPHMRLLVANEPLSSPYVAAQPLFPDFLHLD